MKKLVLFSTLAAATAAAVVLTPMAAGAVAGHYQGNGQGPDQAVRARDGSGNGVALHPETQDRQYVYLEDGTCDGTGPQDGTGVGAQQRMHGRE